MEKRPLLFTYATFNRDALISLAESLRQTPCTCDDTKRPFSGSLNWAIELCFDDDVHWIFRSPRSSQSSGTTAEFASQLLASEAATLKYIRTHTSIPVPEVFHYRYVAASHPAEGGHLK